MEREKIEAFESVKNWKVSLIANSRKGVLSNKNWDSLVNQMRAYLQFIASGPDRVMTPDELRDEGILDPDRAKSRLMRWYNWLQGGAVENYDPRMKVDKEGVSEPHTVSQNTAVTYVGRLRGFYSHNKVAFGKWRMPNRETGEARKADSKLGIYKYDEENGELYVDTPLLQQFLGNLSFRDQGIVLALYSTGQDPTDLFQLTVDWVWEQEGERRLFWEGNRSKTGEAFKTFFSKEATEHVRRYILQEREGAAGGSPIWMNKFNRVMNTEVLNDNFRNVALTMGVTEESKPNPLRGKRFRHLFRTGCTSAGLDPGLSQAFMGHKTPISSEYLSRGKGFLLSQYVRIEPFLTVFRSADQTDIQNIKATLNMAREERDKAKEKLLELGGEIETLRARAGDAKGDRSRLEGEVADLRGEVEYVKDIAVQMVNKYRAVKEIDPKVWAEVEKLTGPPKKATM